MAGAIYTCPYVILSSRKNFTCRNFSLGLKEFEAVCKRHVSSIRSSSVNFVLKNRLPAFERDPCKRRFSCAFAGRVRHSLGGWNWSLSRQCSRWVFFFHWKFDSLTVYSSWIVVKDDVLKGDLTGPYSLQLVKGYYIIPHSRSVNWSTVGDLNSFPFEGNPP